MNYKKADYRYMARRQLLAFQKIAEELGQEHEVTKLMGSLAWGRHNAEPGADAGLQKAIVEKAYLDGIFEILTRWTNIHNNRVVLDILLKHYPRGYATAP